VIRSNADSGIPQIRIAGIPSTRPSLPWSGPLMQLETSGA
jgi:hypothetical protein